VDEWESLGARRISRSASNLWGFHHEAEDITGTSKVALDVMSSVASEYLFNVGRTMRFLCDMFGQKMSPEVSPLRVNSLSTVDSGSQEIILHTLFESGTSKVQDLERYITDDVLRYGSRLGDLEKKLIGAYREAVRLITISL
jgi:transcriptional activator SPT7